eukprot:14865.XXX_972284_975935_1 [CDS] Oithona nana genome sequencing.
MPKVVECVPNFSEGRDRKVIDAIASSIKATPGVTLLDVDPGESTHRTVFTFVGGPESIVEGALNAAKAAFPLIDMKQHAGEHPRMGALDVCPFIPVQDISVEECVQISKQFGRRLADELGVPVYLYGAASEKEYRKTMPQIRSGEYEGLESKLKKSEWAPDFGQADFVSSWGATVTGVRKFLIAYNVNLVSTKEQAHRIALNLRTQGRNGGQAGRLKAVQGIGWWLAEKNIAQISLNLTDMDETPMHIAYEEAKKDATELNIPVTGSEVVGLLPLKALLDAAEYYMEKENLFILHEDQKVHLAINRLGLTTLSPFNAQERIIEYCLPSNDGPLISSTLKQFINDVSARSSVSAVVASMVLFTLPGSGLAAMVGQLTYGKRQWETLDGEMRQLIPIFHLACQEMSGYIDEDTNAFNDYMTALKLPKGSEEEQLVRERALQNGLKTAVKVPMTLATKASGLFTPLKQLAKLGNINCKSDLQVSARCLATAVHGGVHNVKINLESVTDKAYVEEMTKEASKLASEADENCIQILQILEDRH